MPQIIDTLLLVALPASGKSEIRRYLAQVPPEQCEDDFHLGQTVQLDDYPYVHMMRRFSQELRARNHPPLFFATDEDPMLDPRDWGTLIELLNEDYDDVKHGRLTHPAGAAEWLFERFDRARERVGARPAFSALPSWLRKQLANTLEPEVQGLLRDKNAGVPATLMGKTVLIEFARGGAHGSSMPLAAPFGYQHSLSLLSPEILSRAAILYVWVTPEESRRKNQERADPSDPGSILHHGVPLTVMMQDYGCDDIDWLLSRSGRPDMVRVVARGEEYLVPLARFDNRKDKTSFVRAERSRWSKDDVRALHAGLAEAFGRLYRASQMER